MDKWLHPWVSVGCNFSSMHQLLVKPSLEFAIRWITTSHCFTLLLIPAIVPMLVYLISVNKRGHWCSFLPNRHRRPDTLWHHLTRCGLVTPYGNRSMSTSARIMTCCLTAQSHYLNQCWPIISKFPWYSADSSSQRDTSATNHENQLENYLSKITFKYLSGQCVEIFWKPPFYLSTNSRGCSTALKVLVHL